MAKEALKVVETEELEELEVPTGGIGDFVMEDDELEAVYGDDSETDAKEEFGDDGIAQFPALAERMAKYGRNEDNMLAHVAEGELVIPAQFLEDEVMKQRIYDILTEAGVEDPEAYVVVGAEANDLNPTTGLPEFFLKKLFKKIGKAIKKVVKAVVKVVKKVAPIILPIAMPFLLPALGPMYGAALGSGIGTLIGGGSIKDALKSALVAGAIGGVTAGFGKGDGTFFQKVGDAAANPGARFSQAFGNVSEGIQSGSFQGFKDAIGKDFVPTPSAEVAAAGDAAVTQALDPNAPAQNLNTVVDSSSSVTGTLNTTGGDVAVRMPSGAEMTVAAGQPIPAGGEVLGSVKPGMTFSETVAAGETPGFMDSVKGALNPNDDVGFFEGMKDAFMPGKGTVDPTAGNAAYTEAYNNAMTLPGMDQAGAKLAGQTAQSAALDAATKAATPGLLRRFGPTALAGTTLAAGAGFFDVPEIEQANFLDYNPDGTPTTGRDLIDADPGKYLVHNLGQLQLNQETGQYEPVANQTAFEEEDLVGYNPPEQVAALPPAQTGNYLMSSTPGGPFARPYVTQGYQSAADGGPIFPRRTGGIAPTEGTPGEDSVRAMLMPGEFVMTTDAVRGLGNGNLNNGIQNMYSVMRNLESRGRATA